MPNLAIFLFGHQGDDNKLPLYAEVIKRMVEKKAPYTFFLTGMTLDGLRRTSYNVVELMRREMAKPGEIYKPELGISTYHHSPIVQPGLPLEFWGRYFEEFVMGEIEESKDKAEKQFYRTPQGFFPPEGLFAPAAAWFLQKAGLKYGIFSSEHLPSPLKKYNFYPANQPQFRLVSRNNEINIDAPEKGDAGQIAGEISEHCRHNQLENIVLGCDLDCFAGIYSGLSLEGGIARLGCLADALYGKVNFMNCMGIAMKNNQTAELHTTYELMGIPDPHHYINSWMNEKGNLDLIGADKNHMINTLLEKYFRRPKRHLKKELTEILGMEFRHRWFGHFFEDFFWGKVEYLQRELEKTI